MNELSMTGEDTSSFFPKEVAYDIVAHSAGCWVTSVLLRAVHRGVVHAPRRVLLMEVPSLVPTFARIHLQGQGSLNQSLPAPYTLSNASFPWLWRPAGHLAHTL